MGFDALRVEEFRASRFRISKFQCLRSSFFEVGAPSPGSGIVSVVGGFSALGCARNVRWRSRPSGVVRCLGCGTG